MIFSLKDKVENVAGANKTIISELILHLIHIKQYIFTFATFATRNFYVLCFKTLPVCDLILLNIINILIVIILFKICMYTNLKSSFLALKNFFTNIRKRDLLALF